MLAFLEQYWDAIIVWSIFVFSIIMLVKNIIELRQMEEKQNKF